MAEKPEDKQTARALVDLKEYKPLGVEIGERAIERGKRIAPANASEAMQFAALMSRSQSAVPQPFRNNPGLCLGVTMDAISFGMNPFALAREAYDVSGTLAYQAKTYVAAINNSGFLKKRLTFRFDGKIDGTQKITTKKKKWKDGKFAGWETEEKEAPGGSLTCTVIGYLVGEEEPREWESIPLGMIQTKNSPLWYSDPKMQLFYYTSRQWARVYLPEVMMGVVTRDEIEDNPEAFMDVEPEKPTLLKRLKEAKETDAAAKTAEPEKQSGDPQDADFEDVKSEDPGPEPAEEESDGDNEDEPLAEEEGQAAEPPEDQEVGETTGADAEGDTPEDAEEAQESSDGGNGGEAVSGADDAGEPDAGDDAEVVMKEALAKFAKIAKQAAGFDILEDAKAMFDDEISGLPNELAFEAQKEADEIFGGARTRIRRDKRKADEAKKAEAKKK